jgi:hypothetical protein
MVHAVSCENRSSIVASDHAGRLQYHTYTAQVSCCAHRFGRTEALTAERTTRAVAARAHARGDSKIRISSRGQLPSLPPAASTLRPISSTAALGPLGGSTGAECMGMGQWGERQHWAAARRGYGLSQLRSSTDLMLNSG